MSPSGWDWAKLDSSCSGSEPATQFGSIKTETVSNMGFLSVLESGSLLAFRRSPTIRGLSENIDSNSSHCILVDGDTETRRGGRIDLHCLSSFHVTE